MIELERNRQDAADPRVKYPGFLGRLSFPKARNGRRATGAWAQSVGADGYVEAQEAGASALPVVATRHAGIPDVVIEDETGFLVDERDVQGMANHMRRLIDDPVLAGEMGQNGQERIRNHFSMEQSIGRLWSIIEPCIENA